MLENTSMVFVKSKVLKLIDIVKLQTVPILYKAKKKQLVEKTQKLLKPTGANF